MASPEKGTQATLHLRLVHLTDKQQALAHNIKEKEEIEDRWGLVDFAHRIYKHGPYHDARQVTVPNHIANEGEDQKKAHKKAKQQLFRKLEDEFPLEDSIEKLATDYATLTERRARYLLDLGADLCIQKSTYADPTHFKRWQEMAVRIRDLYLRDKYRVHNGFDWALLTAWYIRSVDIALRIADPPKEEGSSSEESET